MPELPEVETVARTLTPEIKGATIVSITSLRDKNIDNPLKEFVSGVQGKTFKDVTRRGKFLIFNLSPNGFILSHLRMEGRYFYEEDSSPARKHDILYYHLSNGFRLAYNDTRKFGRIAYFEDESSLSEALKELGPEPFFDTEKAFYSRAHRLSKPIKEVIMDQKIIVGVGNIYADESLYRAKIHPLSKASALSEEECGSLLRCIQAILKEAIELGGSTIKSYHPKEGVSGRMQNELLAYGHGNRPCPRCGARLTRISLNGRGTTYCPLCQKRKEEKYVVGILGPIHSGKSTVSSILANKGFIVFDADKEAKKLYSLKSVKRKVSLIYPGAIKDDGSIDFAVIRKEASSNESKKKALNGLIFPLIKQKARNFIKKSPQKSNIVLDVPLLFEADMGELCDLTILVSTSFSLQRKRLEEEGKDASALLSLNKGYPLEEAKKKASLLIENSGSLDDLRTKLDNLF